MFRSQLLPDHRTRHCESAHSLSEAIISLLKCFTTVQSLQQYACATQNAFCISMTSFLSISAMSSLNNFHWGALQRHHNVTFFFFFFFFSCSSSFMQPNKPPTRLNLLTCQVKPSVEDKKCFDLISRTTHTNKHTSHANPFPSIITDLAFILLLLSFCLATTLNFSQDINLNFESKMSFLRSHLSTRSFIISFDVNKPLCDTFKQSDGCKHTRCN